MRSSASVAYAATNVNALVRATLYLFVASIPFELPDRTIPIEVPTLTGFIFLAAALLSPGVSFRRIPAALGWVAVYLWVFVVMAVVHEVDFNDALIRVLASMAQLFLLCWAMYNVLADPRAMRGMLLAFLFACSVRAAMQVLGVATTTSEEWTGGERVSVLGQNANLSALILCAGLAVAIGHHVARGQGLVRNLRLLVWPLALVLGFAIIQTGSRGGLISAAVAMLAFGFRGHTASARVRNGVLSVLAIVLLAFGALRSDMMRARFERTAGEGHLAGREVIYPALVEMFTERPLIGWGPIHNQYEVAKRIADPKVDHRDAHNLVLELLTSTGVVGAIPFLVALALCVRGAWRARRGPLGALPLAALAGVLMGTISGTWIASKILWFVLTLALASGAHWSGQFAVVRRREVPSMQAYSVPRMA